MICRITQDISRQAIFLEGIQNIIIGNASIYIMLDLIDLPVRLLATSQEAALTAHRADAVE